MLSYRILVVAGVLGPNVYGITLRSDKAEGCGSD
eukprot:gene601-668_t